jgi:lysozyme
MSNMTTSAAGRATIATREGNKLTAYRDSVNILTIGVGHTSVAGPPKVVEGMKITRAESDEILSRDLKDVEKTINRLVKVELTQNEFDALVSLVFNIGGGAFGKSTLLKKLNAGDHKGAADAFLSWDKAGGKTLSGLTKRRKQERLQFLLARPKAESLPPTNQGTDAPKTEAIKNTETIKSVQQKLRDLGYPEVGDADGKTGTKTTAGILAFRADNGLPLTPAIDEQLLSALMTAKPREIAPARANATAKDLKPASSTIRTADKIKLGGFGLLGGGSILGGLDVVDAVQKARTIYDTVSDILPWVVVLGVGAVAVYYGYKIINNRVQAYREGKAL